MGRPVKKKKSSFQKWFENITKFHAKNGRWDSHDWLFDHKADLRNVFNKGMKAGQRKVK